MQSWNTGNTAVRRVLQELRECQQDDSLDIRATAAEDNLFEWYFAMRGPWDSEFEGGIYHGRILLPAEYPFQPPSFVMATPTGRWEVGTKICLSISSHHPESWQPSWTVRAALVALRVFMQTPAGGAVGALDSSPDVRRALAKESRTFTPKSSMQSVQAQLEDLQRTLLDNEAASKALYDASNRKDGEPTDEPNVRGNDAAAAGVSHAGAPRTGDDGPERRPDVEAEAAAVAKAAEGQSPPATAGERPALSVPPGPDARVPDAQTPDFPQDSKSALPPAAPRTPSPPAVPRTDAAAGGLSESQPPVTFKEERGLLLAASVVLALIIAILIRRVVLVWHIEQSSDMYYYRSRNG